MLTTVSALSGTNLTVLSYVHWQWARL